MPARTMGKRGSILIHVLVTGVLVALICATLLRMSMLRSQMTARNAAVLQDKRNDQGGLAAVFAAWSTGPCSVLPAGYKWAVAVAAGNCGCTLTSIALDALGTPTQTIYTCPNDGNPCTFSRTSAAPTPQQCQLAISSGE